jgi:hypothetical protein
MAQRERERADIFTVKEIKLLDSLKMFKGTGR